MIYRVSTAPQRNKVLYVWLFSFTHLIIDKKVSLTNAYIYMICSSQDIRQYWLHWETVVKKIFFLFKKAPLTQVTHTNVAYIHHTLRFSFSVYFSVEMEMNFFLHYHGNLFSSEHICQTALNFHNLRTGYAWLFGITFQLICCLIVRSAGGQNGNSACYYLLCSPTNFNTMPQN